MGLYDDGPRVVIWEMTRACALACKHCRAEASRCRDRRELTTGEAFRLVDEVAAWGKAIFVLTGGDPLMRPDVYAIVEYAVATGLRVAVAPSATGRLTQPALSRLSAAGCKRISLSLDGPDAATHDAFRGVRGVFDRTLKAALGVLEAGMELQVNTTVGRHNYRSLSEMARLLPELHAVLWSLFFLVPTGRAQRDQCLSAEEHETAFAEIYEISRNSPFDVKTTEAPHYRRYVMQRLGASAPSFPAIGDGKGFVFISHLGEIQPSGFLPFTVGNFRDERLLDAYRGSNTLRRLRDPDGFSGKCGRCDFRLICGGSRARAYAFTGDPFAAEPCCSYVAPAGAEVRVPS